jgi:hypothetical protein
MGHDDSNKTQRAPPQQQDNMFAFDATTAQVGSHLLSAGSSMVSERLGRGWASINALRYYFAVNNSYVQNKLRLLLFPFLHKNWTRLVVNQSSDQVSIIEHFQVTKFDLLLPGSI